VNSGYSEGRMGPGSEPGVERRIGLVALAIVLAFSIFFIRLFQLQIVEGADLRSRSERNFVRTVRLEAPRGDILDREGRVLATTRPAHRVQVIPNEAGGRQLTYGLLGEILGRSPAELEARVGSPRGRARFQPVELEGDLSYPLLAQIESHRYALPGVVTDILPRRHYVEGDRAAHLLGTIGEIEARQLASDEFDGYKAGEIVGQFGLELRLESHLRGKAGGLNLVVDVAGREIEVLAKIDPVPGGRAILTIDLDLQRAAEEGFLAEGVDGSEKMGALVAIDPRSGEILAMVSRPAYDPNAFAGGIDAQTWQELMGHEWNPLRNRALSGQYPPGSTYKAIVAIAGLAEKEITPEETVFCPGYYRLGRRVYRCWKQGGHGDVNLLQAIKGSCDVYFYQLGIKLGIDRIANYARRFGLGEPTGIGLRSEKGGLIPTKAWKQRARDEPWIKGETVSAAIGQGFNLVTPIQLAVAYAAIANGGTVYVPHVVKRLETWDGELVAEPDSRRRGEASIPPDVLDVVRAGLVAVVQDADGTGRRARVKEVTVAGKTGTTQVVSLDFVKGLKKEEIPIRYRDHALFTAFAPAENAQIAIAVLVEHAGAGGGSVAAPIAQRVLARYFEKKQARAEAAIEAVGAAGVAAGEGG
jgi:penicillin-binding protein 2